MSKTDQLLKEIKENNSRATGMGSFIVLAAGVHTGLGLESIVCGGAAVTFTVFKEISIATGGVATDKMAARGLANVAPSGSFLPAPKGFLIDSITTDEIVIGYYPGS